MSPWGLYRKSRANLQPIGWQSVPGHDSGLSHLELSFMDEWPGSKQRSSRLVSLTVNGHYYEPSSAEPVAEHSLVQFADVPYLGVLSPLPNQPVRVTAGLRHDGESWFYGFTPSIQRAEERREQPCLGEREYFLCLDFYTEGFSRTFWFQIVNEGGTWTAVTKLDVPPERGGAANPLSTESGGSSETSAG